MRTTHVDDLESLDDAARERIDTLFADVLRLNRPDPVDHASKIIALADAPALVDYDTED